MLNITLICKYVHSLTELIYQENLTSLVDVNKNQQFCQYYCSKVKWV